MDSGKKSEDGIVGIQMTPGKVDIVLGAHPRSQKKAARRNKGRGYSSLAVMVALAAIGIYLLLPRTQAEQTEVAPKVTGPTAMTGEDYQRALIETPEPEAPRLTVQPHVRPDYAGPNVVRRGLPAPESQPLDECMKDGNVIDENVISCRFGQVPRSTERMESKGMVSPGYMAGFKSDIARNTGERSTKSYSVASVSIRAVDSRSRYRADFRIANNRIDNGSVCMNFAKASVENRECRRAAVVFFKESCLEWSKRAAKDRDEQSKLTRERYCEANRTFGS
jgi:hypothetical protein